MATTVKTTTLRSRAFLIGFIFLAIAGIMVAYLARAYYHFAPCSRRITIDSLNLTKAQLDLLAELGIDRARLQFFLDHLNSSKLFISSSLDSFLTLLNTNKEAAAKLYTLAASHAEHYAVLLKILSTSAPSHAQRLRQSLARAAANGATNLKTSGEEALKEWKRYVKESAQGKAVAKWMKGALQEYKQLIHSASTALPQRITEWCEGLINHLLD